jgi:glycosyltransferase involved in cell wall biosynthesis
MRLTVLNVAYPFAPVGPDAVGGAEQILSELDRALYAAGHISLVAACEGSRTAGQLFSVPLPPDSELNDAGRRWSRAAFQSVIDRALASRHVDLIHMHGFDFHQYRLPVNTPVLVTLHLPTQWYPPAIWNGRSRMVYQFVSESQRQSAPPQLREGPVVPNGVALPSFSARRKGDYALALGRICPEKNLHEALEAGNRAGVRVLLGGQVFPYAEHRTYFSSRIEPLLGRDAIPRHEFVGTLSAERKSELLQSAKCLLHPTLAPETSSLVAMEAMAAGTPVIAYRSGALPEIVEDGMTGFLVDDAWQMARAIERVDNIRPEDCRHAAEGRFSRERMVRQYFELYEVIAGTGGLARGA